MLSVIARQVYRELVLVPRYFRVYGFKNFAFVDHVKSIPNQLIRINNLTRNFFFFKKPFEYVTMLIGEITKRDCRAS